MASERVFSVRVEWDAEAEVWYVADSDVPGLAAEAATVDKMLDLLRVLVPEMLYENGLLADGEHPTVPFQMILDHLESNRLSC